MVVIFQSTDNENKLFIGVLQTKILTPPSNIAFGARLSHPR